MNEYTVFSGVMNRSHYRSQHFVTVTMVSVAAAEPDSLWKF